MFFLMSKTTADVDFSKCRESNSVMELIRLAGPIGSTIHFQIVDAGGVVHWEQLPSQNPRDVEPLVGDNLGIVHLKVDKYHVGTSYLSICRDIRDSIIKNWKAIPRQLRRGMILAVIERHNSNRGLYRSVMSGSF